MEKKEADKALDPVISTLQTMWKNIPELLVCLNKRIINNAILKVWTMWRQWGAACVVKGGEKWQCPTGWSSSGDSFCSSKITISS
jgi:hypothetical protein